MNSFPTILIQAPSQSTHDQTTSGNNLPVFTEIRIVLMQGSSTATNRQDTAMHQIPLVIQMPVQKQIKRRDKKKLKQKPKRKQQQQQTSRQRKTTETNQMEIETLSPSQAVVQRPNAGTSEHSALVELIEQHESTSRRITTCDIPSTANKAIQASHLDTPTPNDVGPTSNDSFWNVIEDDFDRMVTECTNEELEAMINRGPLNHHDLLDELLS